MDKHLAACVQPIIMADRSGLMVMQCRQSSCMLVTCMRWQVLYTPPACQTVATMVEAPQARGEQRHLGNHVVQLASSCILCFTSPHATWQAVPGVQVCKEVSSGVIKMGLLQGPCSPGCPRG